MPMSKHEEAVEEQAARLGAEVEKLVAAGGLSPTEAHKALAKMFHGNHFYSRCGK